MSGTGGHAGGGNSWERGRTTVTGPDGVTEVTYHHERGGGDHGEGHSGKRWGWGKTLLLIGALAGVGAAAFYGGRAVEAGKADHVGEPSRGEAGPEDGDPVVSDSTPAATVENAGETVVVERESEVTVAGNIGQLEMEVPRDIETVERGGVHYAQVTLVFEDPPRDGQIQFRACEGDEGCAEALEGVANAGNLGVLTGAFSVEVPPGEPNKRMISYSVPERVTWRGRTITINPDTTRVRAGDGEFVRLREVLGEPRD